MISKAFQKILTQMSENVDYDMGVLDYEGYLLASVGQVPSIEETSQMTDECLSTTEDYYCNGYYVTAIGVNNGINYISYVKGEGEEVQRFCHILKIALENMELYYDEKYDKTTFIKNILLGNLLPFDFRQKARELHVDVEVLRALFLVRIPSEADSAAYDVLRRLFPVSEKNYVINISENSIVVVKEYKDEVEISELEDVAKSIVETINSEAMVKANVGISSLCSDVGELGMCFKEAQVALDVGNVFEKEKCIVSYDNLGIGRLIYQLPTTLCELFLKEVLKKGSIDSLDEETVLTIQKFFENDLNVSETSRQLFVHRNTLVYRLDKIYKITGLDLRKFDQAIVFKVAMMVNKYLKSDPMEL